MSEELPSAELPSPPALLEGRGGWPIGRPVTFGQLLADLTPRVVVTPAIIAANVAVYLWMCLHGTSALGPTPADLLHWGANYGPRTAIEPWRLFSSMFVHIGLLHIAFNMLVLRDIGRLMERLVGNLGVAALYLTSGLAGSLLAVIVHPYVVSAGASGAIFGLYGGLLGLLASRRLQVPTTVLKGLRSSTLAFVGYNLVFGVVVPGIDLTCHLGGLGAGFLCGLLLAQPLERPSLPWRPVRAAVVAALGVGVLGASSRLPRYPDLQAEVANFARAEHDTLFDLKSGFARWQKGTETQRQLAVELRTRIIPPWRAARVEFAKVRDLPGPQRQTVKRLVFYIDARLLALDTLEQALSDNDGRRLDQGLAQLSRSEQIAEQFGKND